MCVVNARFKSWQGTKDEFGHSVGQCVSETSYMARASKSALDHKTYFKTQLKANERDNILV